MVAWHYGSSAVSAGAKKNSRDFYWQHVHILRLITSRSPFGGKNATAQKLIFKKGGKTFPKIFSGKIVAGR